MRSLLGDRDATLHTVGPVRFEVEGRRWSGRAESVRAAPNAPAGAPGASGDALAVVQRDSLAVERPGELVARLDSRAAGPELVVGLAELPVRRGDDIVSLPVVTAAVLVGMGLGFIAGVL